MSYIQRQWHTLEFITCLIKGNTLRHVLTKESVANYICKHLQMLFKHLKNVCPYRQTPHLSRVCERSSELLKIYIHN